MLISVKKRFIFIANSKTASTSIEAALAPYAEINRIGSALRKHISWEASKQEYKFLFKLEEYHPDSFFKFGVVREPAEWVLSWYNYRLGNQKLPNSLPKDMTFYQFWKSIDRIKDISQKANFADEDGICRFDLIIPHQEIGRAFPVVVKSLKIPLKVTLPTKNKSEGQTLARNKLSAEIVAEINAYYQQDFDLWQEWSGNIDSCLEGLAK